MCCCRMMWLKSENAPGLQTLRQTAGRHCHAPAARARHTTHRALRPPAALCRTLPAALACTWPAIPPPASTFKSQLLNTMVPKATMADAKAGSAGRRAGSAYGAVRTRSGRSHLQGHLPGGQVIGGRGGDLHAPAHQVRHDRPHHRCRRLYKVNEQLARIDRRLLLPTGQPHLRHLHHEHTELFQIALLLLLSLSASLACSTCIRNAGSRSLDCPVWQCRTGCEAGGQIYARPPLIRYRS